MPQTTKTSTKTTTTSSKTADTNNAEMEEIVTKNKQLEDEINELKAMLQTLMEKSVPIANASSDTVDTVSVTTTEELSEPLPNKNIKIVSLYYGTLNLTDGHGTKLTFNKYGDTKNCLYGKLVDIINHDLKFAEAGMFYIADKAAVYHLGLSDAYKSIQPKEVLNNIYKYDDNTINSICATLTDEQKDAISFGLAKRIHDGEKLDLNKIAVVSQAIGIDIAKLVEEMQEVDRNNAK